MMLADQVDDHPATITLLDMSEREGGDLRAAQAAAEECGQDRAVAHPLRVVGSGASSSRWASAWLSQLPVRLPAEGTPLTLLTPAAGRAARCRRPR